jgi:hypothetical protein
MAPGKLINTKNDGRVPSEWYKLQEKKCSSGSFAFTATALYW